MVQIMPKVENRTKTKPYQQIPKIKFYHQWNLCNVPSSGLIKDLKQKCGIKISIYEDK